MQICKSTRAAVAVALRKGGAPCGGGAWGLACLSLPLSSQTLTLRTVRTVDSKLQVNRRIYLDTTIKHIKELLKPFKEFRSSGFKNCYDLQLCKVNIHRLPKIEIKFKDSQITVPLSVSRWASTWWLRDQGFFHLELHHFSVFSSGIVRIYMREQRRKENMENSTRYLEAISDSAAHNYCPHFADQNSDTWPHQRQGFGKYRIMVLWGRKMQFRYCWALPLSTPWCLCKIKVSPLGRVCHDLILIWWLSHF